MRFLHGLQICVPPVLTLPTPQSRHSVRAELERLPAEQKAHEDDVQDYHEVAEPLF